ncbi:hypothetical protein PHJA_002058800 [Phtheirospermum japonicum]|uniref:Uncharacterized protein n=1 Tax=Phtheirospermum japonicum TaxID=374723 RepID=A0A830CJH9_9LAMI|nr:hypothetical protein PHJA_002058800 [Phtheirospermum japonicum]
MRAASIPSVRSNLVRHRWGLVNSAYTSSTPFSIISTHVSIVSTRVSILVIKQAGPIDRVKGKIYEIKSINWFDSEKSNKNKNSNAFAEGLTPPQANTTNLVSFTFLSDKRGFGIISAAGGRGWGGGGGGRISLNCYSKQEDVKVTVHGGLSIGCSWNSGAAGTYFDASVLSLRVSNDNVTTETETPLLDFSTSPLWTNVYVENNAKVLVPLLWTRVQPKRTPRGALRNVFGKFGSSWAHRTAITGAYVSNCRGVRLDSDTPVGV